MKTKLSGWQRLWVVAAGLYLLVIASVTWLTWPTSASVPHEYKMYSSLAPEVRARIFNTQIIAENEQAFIQEARTAKDADLVEMPNGHKLVFRKGLPRAEAEAAARAYWSTVESVTSQNRVTHLLQGIAWWAFPLAFIYVLGLAVRWIYHGFKQS